MRKPFAHQRSFCQCLLILCRYHLLCERILGISYLVIKAEPMPYILMIALLPFLNTLFFMSSVKSFDTIQSNEKKHLNSLSLISLIIAAYLFSIIIIQQTLPLNLPARIIVLLVLLILLASPLYSNSKLLVFVLRWMNLGNYSVNEIIPWKPRDQCKATSYECVRANAILHLKPNS